MKAENYNEVKEQLFNTLVEEFKCWENYSWKEKDYYFVLASVSGNISFPAIRNTMKVCDAFNMVYKCADAFVGFYDGEFKVIVNQRG